MPFHNDRQQEHNVVTKMEDVDPGSDIYYQGDSSTLTNSKADVDLEGMTITEVDINTKDWQMVTSTTSGGMGR